MKLDYSMNMTQEQRLILTQNMQQSIKLLQMSLHDLREYIDKHCIVEGDLRRDIAFDIKRLIEIGCYRGVRHRKGLPVRGQRSKTNARTRKGPRKTMANKKK